VLITVRCVGVQDFESDSELKRGVKELLEDMMCSSSVMPSEQKAAASILNVLMKEADQTQVQLDQLLTPPLVSITKHLIYISQPYT
jgi:hypothetical protein